MTESHILQMYTGHGHRKPLTITFQDGTVKTVGYTLSGNGPFYSSSVSDNGTISIYNASGELVEVFRPNGIKLIPMNQSNDLAD